MCVCVRISAGCSYGCAERESTRACVPSVYEELVLRCLLPLLLKSRAPVKKRFSFVENSLVESGRAREKGTGSMSTAGGKQEGRFHVRKRICS